MNILKYHIQSTRFDHHVSSFHLGTGISGTSQVQLNNPVQVQFDSNHNLYVVDQKNHRIQRFDLLNNGC
jgi:hypothetical protein